VVLISIAEGKNPVGTTAANTNPITIGGVDGDNKIVGLVLNSDGSITAKLAAGTEIAGKFIPVDADGDEKFTAANPASVQLTGSIVTQDDEGNDVLRIADVAPWGYDPVTQSIITKNNAFSKLDIIANAISILPGNNSGLLDLGITTETEIWIEVLIDKQPWTARIYGYPHAPENGLTTGLYPKRSSYTTAHTSVELPCRSMVLGIAASVSTGLIDPASLADAQYFKTPVPGLKLHITNLHATDTATLTVRVLRFWKG